MTWDFSQTGWFNAAASDAIPDGHEKNLPKSNGNGLQDPARPQSMSPLSVPFNLVVALFSWRGVDDPSSGSYRRSLVGDGSLSPLVGGYLFGPSRSFGLDICWWMYGLSSEGCRRSLVGDGSRVAVRPMPAPSLLRPIAPLTLRSLGSFIQRRLDRHDVV